jgi:oligopeptide/dipeptide ABC transporter ATP-binding protein
MPHEALLQVDRLSIQYQSEHGPLDAVQNVSFVVRENEVFGLVGESGSGKSTIAKALMRTLEEGGWVSGGSVYFGETDVLGLEGETLRQFRWRRIAMVFQGALNVLNPVLTIGEQICDTLFAHEPNLAKEAATARARELLELVGIAPERLGSYAHELSGGMRQRVMIAIALSLSPDLLILDEPTTSLDVLVQREILAHLARLRENLGFSVLFITHDLPLLFEYADRVAVLYSGEIIEMGAVRDLLLYPAHPYTAALFASIPSLSAPTTELRAIRGAPPSLHERPPGCAYHPRCDRVIERCQRVAPDAVISSHHLVRCHVATPPPAPTLGTVDSRGPNHANSNT